MSPPGLARPASAARLALARALAWALLLAGWIGLATLAERLTAGPLEAAGVLAAWLFATGLASEVLARVRWPVGLLRAALPLAAGMAAVAAQAAVQGGGRPALLALALAWAAVLALASTTVRALRHGAPGTRPASPVGAATAGAVLAWAAVGDPSDLPALADRLALLLVPVALWLALLRPPHATLPRPGCRAGLFDCSMPAWPRGAWRDPACWPPSLAALVMLPMMAGLPQMLALCRGDGVPAHAVLALHLAAMVVPACLLGAARRPGLAADRLAAACAALLVAGALAGLAGGPVSGWGLALAHGAAWSLAWAARLAPGAAPATALPAPWRAAAGSAGLVLLLGAAQALAGPVALTAVHIGLGALAAVALGAAAARRISHPAWARRPGRP